MNKPADPFQLSTTLWWETFKADVEYRTLGKYRASIPPIPNHLRQPDLRHPTLTCLLLSDPRLPIMVRAERMGVNYGHEEDIFVPLNERHSIPSDPYWLMASDGIPKNDRGARYLTNDDIAPDLLGLDPDAIRRACVGELLAATSDVILSHYLHHRGKFPTGYYDRMVLGLGSTRADDERERRLNIPKSYVILAKDWTTGMSLYLGSHGQEEDAMIIPTSALLFRR